MNKKSTPTQRTLNALDTKNTIFNTALALFSKYGYDQVTVDEITSTAGVSKGTFYTHFQTKESVLVEQFHKIDAYYDKVFSQIPNSTTASERLLILVRAMTEYCANICGVHLLQIVYASQVSSARCERILNNKERQLYYHLRQIVRLGKNSGEFISALSEEDLVELLARSCRGLIYDWCLYGNELDLIQEGQRYFKIILTKLTAKT